MVKFWLAMTGCLVSLVGAQSHLVGDFCPLESGRQWVLQGQGTFGFLSSIPNASWRNLRDVRVLSKEAGKDSLRWQIQVKDSLFARVVNGKMLPDTVSLNVLILIERDTSMTLSGNEDMMLNEMFGKHEYDQSLLRRKTIEQVDYQYVGGIDGYNIDWEKLQNVGLNYWYAAKSPPYYTTTSYEEFHLVRTESAWFMPSAIRRPVAARRAMTANLQGLDARDVLGRLNPASGLISAASLLIAP